MNRMWNLKHCTAVVTGGSKGIGRATVIELANLGAKVLFTARQEEDLKQLEKQLRKDNLDVTGLVADVSISEDRNLLFKTVEEKWGILDILVHNAGVNIRKKANDYTEKEYRKVLEINLFSPFEISRQLYPLLKKSSRGTVIMWLLLQLFRM